MRRSLQRAFTRVELVVVILLILMLTALLFPMIEASRENARQTSCADNMKQIGLALYNFADARKCFPGSTSKPFGPKDEAWTKSPVIGATNLTEEELKFGNGFSWQTMIIPFVEMSTLYQRLDTVGNGKAVGPNSRPGGPWQIWKGDAETINNRSSKNVCHPLFWKTSHDVYLCPNRSRESSSIDNTMKLYGDEITTVGGVDTTPAASSYVALAATHNTSLTRQVDPEFKFAGGKKHPNGVMYPGSKSSLKSIHDGASNTVIVCETKEPTYAAWFDGTTAGVVGLQGDIESTSDFFVQADSTQNSKSDDSPIPWGKPRDTIRTTLNYGDQPNEFYMKGIVPFAEQTKPDGKEWRYGPSSEHPGVVLHLFADCKVRAISEELSPIVYMQLITRAGGESFKDDCLPKPFPPSPPKPETKFK